MKLTGIEISVTRFLIDDENMLCKETPDTLFIPIGDGEDLSFLAVDVEAFIHRSIKKIV